MLLKQSSSRVLKLFFSLFINHVLLLFQLSISAVNDMWIFDTFETALNMLLDITTLRYDDVDTKYYMFES